jgi:hypothetical protein
MLGSKKSTNFFGACSVAPFARVWNSGRARAGSLPSLAHVPHGTAPRSHFRYPAARGIKPVKIGTAVARIEATR